MAWCYGLEGSGSALLGPPTVALLAQHAFGYVPSHLVDLSDISPQQATTNATALRNSLIIMLTVSWAAAAALYSFVSLSYPRERDAAALARKVLGS